MSDSLPVGAGDGLSPELAPRAAVTGPSLAETDRRARLLAVELYIGANAVERMVMAHRFPAILGYVNEFYDQLRRRPS